MDALRLIKTSRHALAEARTVPDVLAEARQAALLTEAVGARLAEREDQEDGELALLGQLLSAAGTHAAGCLEQPPPGSSPPDSEQGTLLTEASGSGMSVTGMSVRCWPEPGSPDSWPRGRAGRLTELGALEPMTAELGRLLHDMAETLVVLACGADTESLYWTCVDGIDAGTECRDLVADLHRAVRRAEGIEGPDPDEPWEPDVDPDTGTNAGEGADVGPDADTGPDTDVGPEIDVGPEADMCPEAGTGLGAGVGSGRDRGAVADRRVPVRPVGGGTPLLVVRLDPPPGCDRCGYRVRGASGRSVAGPSDGAAGAGAVPRAPEDCSAARSAVTEASSSCICSSRLLGGAGTADGSAACGAVVASEQDSDMRRPLRIGSAV